MSVSVTNKSETLRDLTLGRGIGIRRCAPQGILLAGIHAGGQH
jgi:hypothetical protein